MKKYNSSSANIAAIIVALFAFAPIAHAAVISGGATTVVSNDGVVVHTDTKLSTSASATPITGVHIVGGVNTAGGAKMEDGSDTKENESMEQKDGHSGEVRGENEDELDGVNKGEIYFDFNDSDFNDGKGDIEASSDVHSEIDLKYFIAHKAKADAHIKAVEVSGGKVEVEYEESGKWFGVLTGKVNAHASADVKGNVEVKYPWYHIFMNGTHSSASLQSQIARAIAAEKKADKAGVSSTTLRADASATFGVPDLFEIIANTLKKTSASATVTAAVK